MPTKPDWTRDELILALDLYLKNRARVPGRESNAIQSLSRGLRSMWGADRSDDPTFRNTNGVYMKLMNFRAIDPEYTAQGKRGFEHGSAADVSVWRDFANQPLQLEKLASLIREQIAEGETLDVSNQHTDEIAEAIEGRLLTRLHTYRERDRNLINRKKLQALSVHGRFLCECCGFDFEDAYGERGTGFIEVHHLLPLHELSGDTRTGLDDLALLCSNCHRMIHVRSPWLKLEELRAMRRNV